MAFISRVRAVSTGWNGAPGLNTCYFVEQTSGVDTDPTESGAVLCVNRVQAAMDAVKGVFPAAWRVKVSPFVDIIDPSNGDLMGSWAGPVNAEIAGTSGSNYLPPSTCLLAQLRTNTFTDGRKIQGLSLIHI